MSRKDTVYSDHWCDVCGIKVGPDTGVAGIHFTSIGLAEPFEFDACCYAHGIVLMARLRNGAKPNAVTLSAPVDAAEYAAQKPALDAEFAAVSTA